MRSFKMFMNPPPLKKTNGRERSLKAVGGGQAEAACIGWLRALASSAGTLCSLRMHVQLLAASRILTAFLLRP